jgi:PAS domain S-box-containing protein
VYAISVVPTQAKIVARRYDDAMKKVRELAQARAVDGWYTCDHTHFLRVASHRLAVDLAVRILDGSPDAILICDRAGMVRYWNTAAERIFGFRATEMVGGSMNRIIPERFRSRHWAGWEATMRTGITRYAEGQLLAVPALHKDGRQISIEFSIQLLKDAEGQIEWMAAIVRDVTKRFIREKNLRAHLKASGETMGKSEPTQR